MDRKVVALTALLSTLATVGGCSQDSKSPTMHIEARVTMCIDAGKKCYSLGVPKASVTVEKDGNVLATGTTDAAGNANLTLKPGDGQLQLKVASPLLEGGAAESTTPYPDASSSVTIDQALSSNIKPPGK